MGEPAFLSDEFSGATKADPDVELVSTSGKFFEQPVILLNQPVILLNQPIILLNQPMAVYKTFSGGSAYLEVSITKCKLPIEPEEEYHQMKLKRTISGQIE